MIQHDLLKKKDSVQTHTEQGRSMVEMLGVLAIIGVLSIGGIAGYRLSLNKYKANQIIDLASKLSVISQTQSAADPDNWSGLSSQTIEELGMVDYGWGAGAYETTFSVYLDGSVSVWTPNEGIADAIESITGDRFRIISVE